MIKSIVNTLISFIETKLEIYKIQLKEEAAKFFTLIVLIIVFGLIGLLFILFLSFFIAEIINALFVHRFFRIPDCCRVLCYPWLDYHVLFRGKIRKELPMQSFLTK
jgi:uncharacterized membrane protein YqjE